MAEKKTILVHPNGNEFEFDADHAERIMAMANNGGWQRKKQPKKKTGKNANTSGADTGEATGTPAPEEDCGCH